MGLERPTPYEYEVLDRYLETAFNILEGMSNVAEAEQILAEYLAFHRNNGLPSHLEELLKELLRLKKTRDGQWHNEGYC
jgi:hypothetical protein